MISYVKSFNESVEALIDGKNNSAYNTVQKLKKEFNYYKDYYSMFDSISCSLGISIIAVGVDDAKTDKELGYLPILRFQKNNKLNESPRDSNLGISEPINIDDCYAILAKGFLYSITHHNNIVDLIKEQ